MTGHQEDLDPDYLADILELVNRIIKSPNAAAGLLLYLDATFDWCELMGESDLSGVFGTATHVSTIVLARDCCITFCRATGVNEDLFAGLMVL
ncbi:hypothetical protein D3C86_1240070 [compost metagenome]